MAAIALEHRRIQIQHGAGQRPLELFEDELTASNPCAIVIRVFDDTGVMRLGIWISYIRPNFIVILPLSEYPAALLGKALVIANCYH